MADNVMMSVAGTPVTFGQMRDRSCAAAHVLTDLGVRRGDTVALFTGTCPEWVYFWLGAARIGAVTAAVNGAAKGDYLVHALRLARARVVVTDPQRQARVAEVADGVDTVESTVVSGPSLSDRLASAPTSPPPVAQIDDRDVGALFFTSGTTGPSKAVATAWPYLIGAATTVGTAWELSAGDVVWTAMPLFHLSAAPTVLTPLVFGSTTVVAAEFHPGTAWDEVKGCGAVGFAGAGAMISMLWNLPRTDRDAALGLRFISAAPISADRYRDIESRYRCRVVTMYGMTEAFPIAYKSVADDGVPGTSGRVSSAFEVRIVDPSGNPLPRGKVGEITCRARSTHAMSEGYVSAAFGGSPLRIDAHPEWFATGDLGTLDDDDNLTFTDRAKDCLRRRGENVSSVELETTVMGHPAVAEAAAVGVPSELGEDDILVVVVPRAGMSVDYEDLMDFCADRMPYFCVPRYVDVVDEIPKNIIGRVRKDLLRQRGLGPHAWDRDAHGYVLTR